MLFASPEECETAFYEALQNADTDAMADLWLQDDEVCCTHPGAARIVGYAGVRASWSSILGAGPVSIRTLARRSFESPSLAVTNLVEEVAVVQGNRRQIVHVLASNAYAKTPSGWKMVMHMGAAAPEGRLADAEPLPGTVH